MKILLLLGIVTLTMASSDRWVWSSWTLPQRPVNPIIRGENNFSPMLFKSIAETKSGNVVCSPLSVFLALSMLAQGAQWRTLRDMNYVLGFYNQDNSNLVRIQNFINGLNNYHEVELRVANKIFVDGHYKIKDKFREITEKYFHSKSENLNFWDSIKASETVNKWCMAQTNNRIKDLVTPENFGLDAALILLNAVYFKGTWKTKFDVRDTVMRRFTTHNGVVKLVETMFVSSKFNYGELDSVNARFVELPYKNKNSADTLSMFIILPNQVNGLAELEKNLNKVTVNALIRARKERDVDVYLPKFKIESKIDLKDPLEKLGLYRLFRPLGDFIGINDDESLYVSSIEQKAFIEVNEEGSEAAAVTDIGLSLKFGEGKDTSVIFIANHPFMAIIATTSNESGAHLFSTRYTGSDN